VTALLCSSKPKAPSPPLHSQCDERFLQRLLFSLSFYFINRACCDEPAFLDDAYSITQLFNDGEDVTADEDGFPSTIR